MSDATAAADVLAGLEYSNPQIRNKRVYWQYSDRVEVEAKTAVYVVDNRVTGQTQGSLDPHAATTILLSVTSVTIPVSLENIHQISSPFGDVLRIITFHKGADFQALVEFSSSDEANRARVGLDGKDVYEGCCHIRANFSNKNTLSVKQNDDRSWDYTIGRASQAFPPVAAGFGGAAFGYSGYQGFDGTAAAADQFGGASAYGLQGGQYAAGATAQAGQFGAVSTPQQFGQYGAAQKPAAPYGQQTATPSAQFSQQRAPAQQAYSQPQAAAGGRSAGQYY